MEEIYDKRTLFFTNLSGSEEDVLRMFIQKCCEKIGIEMPNIIINLVAKYNIYTKEYSKDFGYINCVDPELYRMILNMDEEFNPINSENHVLGEDLFIKEDGFFFSADKNFTFKRYDASFYYNDYTHSNIISSFVKIERYNEEMLKTKVKELVSPFSTGDEKYPKVKLSFTRNLKFVNVKFCPNTNDGIFSLPFLHKPKITIGNRDIILNFTTLKKRNC